MKTTTAGQQQQQRGGAPAARRQTYSAWAATGGEGFFITTDRVGARIVIARTEHAYPDGLFTTILGGFIVNRSAPTSATRDADEPQEWMEWIAHPDEAIAFGWLEWETLGDVTRAEPPEEPPEEPAVEEAWAAGVGAAVEQQPQRERSIDGARHHVSAKHLHRYLAEL